MSFYGFLKSGIQIAADNGIKAEAVLVFGIFLNFN